MYIVNLNVSRGFFSTNFVEVFLTLEYKFYSRRQTLVQRQQ